MDKTTFNISKMDCPSEENLIRMKLNDYPFVKHLEFDIPKRILTVFHENHSKEIDSSLQELNLGSNLISTEIIENIDFEDSANQSKILWSVLIINALFFVIEITTGIISKSMGLVADSLDMLADSFVYGISLLAVGGSVIRKKRIAKLAGYFQLILAIIGFSEVVRRFIGAERMPDFNTMIIVSVFALIANALCLILLQKSKSKEAHMQASMIFTSNDVIINLGVIIAGSLVYWLNSSYPDLIVGLIVFILVVQGALRILKLSK